MTPKQQIATDLRKLAQRVEGLPTATEKPKDKEAGKAMPQIAEQATMIRNDCDRLEEALAKQDGDDLKYAVGVIMRSIKGEADTVYNLSLEWHPGTATTGNTDVKIEDMRT
jgi:hypothetical protein